MNFRRRRRLIELLHERSRGIPESHDSPFCLRKQQSDGGNTSFLSDTRTEAHSHLVMLVPTVYKDNTGVLFVLWVMLWAGALWCEEANPVTSRRWILVDPLLRLA
ncbi:hypothetical protein GOODEAATRI_018420 [Goodea atripinnis]|uniref:Uncharacterized protein n=1 Tax=Goodea atripinnis TaxID=208336 RepID=A0ABV0PF69_9TELE